MVAAMDDDVLERLATQAHDAQEWDALLPIALAFDEEARRRLAGLSLLGREDVLHAAIDAAARHDLWDAALPLADALPDNVKPRIAAAIDELSDEHLRAAIDAAARSDNLITLVDIALRQDVEGWERVVAIVAEQPPGIRDLVRDRAAALGRDDVVAALTPTAAKKTAARRTRSKPAT
jgi:hypothetical protein